MKAGLNLEEILARLADSNAPCAVNTIYGHMSVLGTAFNVPGVSGRRVCRYPRTRLGQLYRQERRAEAGITTRRTVTNPERKIC